MYIRASSSSVNQTTYIAIALAVLARVKKCDSIIGRLERTLYTMQRGPLVDSSVVYTFAAPRFTTRGLHSRSQIDLW